jgi:hypothetical protein
MTFYLVHVVAIFLEAKDCRKNWKDNLALAAMK